MFLLSKVDALANYAGSTQMFYEAQVIELPKEETIEERTREDVRAYVLEQARIAGVTVAKIDYIVENESHYDPKAIGDINIPCTNKQSPIYGQGAYARGIWQITRCWYPDITDEQAHSVEWSTEWALKIISSSKNDCITQWTTCRNWYGK